MESTKPKNPELKIIFTFIADQNSTTHLILKAILMHLHSLGSNFRGKRY